MLAHQLVAMRKINWRKHRRTQISLILSGLGIAAIAVSVLLR